MIRLSSLLLELAILLLAIFAAHSLQAHINFIPSSIVALPQVDYSIDDLKITLIYYALPHLFIFIAMQWRKGPWCCKSGLSDSTRTAYQLFGLAAGFAISTLSQFLTSTANFDPNLMVGIVLLNVSITVLLFVLASALKSVLVDNLITLIGDLLRRCIRPSGIVILVLALSPAILAKAFVSNRDLANTITQWRMFFSGETEFGYSLVSAVGDQRFLQPMQIKMPSGDGKLYILERSGRFYRMNGYSDTTPELILDLRDEVGYIEMENGALGFAFHPNYGSDNHFCYLYYTSVLNNKQRNILSRFDLSGDTSQARKSTELPLMRLDRESSGFHNGGSIEFGPDGFLYVALGEGIRTPASGSLTKTLRMAIMRIDVDQQGGSISQPIKRHPGNGITQNYYIPQDNPFIDNEYLLDEYWALGLRNPYRMAFDGNTLWVGDVGSTEWEEINLVSGGNHYQFPFAEGHEETGKRRPDPMTGKETPPLFDYYHSATERAIIGGIVYRGELHKELAGSYLFADNYAGNLYQLIGSSPSLEKRQIAHAGDYAQRGISSVTALADGNVLVTTLGRANQATGKILKLVPGQVTDQSDSENSLPLTNDDIAEIFTTNCARCHGAKGKGDGPDQKLLGIEIADFSESDYSSLRTNQSLRKIIAKGGQSEGLSPMMPPWENILEKAEIDALVDFINSLSDEH